MPKQLSPEKDQIDKLEAENLEEMTVYTVEIGYNKYSTDNKEAAYSLWTAINEGFYNLESVSERYDKPLFSYRKPIEVKLSSVKTQVWKSYESATRAHNAFKALSSRATEEDKS